MKTNITDRALLGSLDKLGDKFIVHRLVDEEAGAGGTVLSGVEAGRRGKRGSEKGGSVRK
jgi:hypothetical protein